MRTFIISVCCVALLATASAQAEIIFTEDFGTTEGASLRDDLGWNKAVGGNGDVTTTDRGWGTGQVASGPTLDIATMRLYEGFSRSVAIGQDVTYSAKVECEYGAPLSIMGIGNAAEYASTGESGILVYQISDGWRLTLKADMVPGTEQMSTAVVWDGGDDPSWYGNAIDVVIHVDTANDETWAVFSLGVNSYSTTKLTFTDGAEDRLDCAILYWATASHAASMEIDNISVFAVPEPVTLATLALGGLLALLRRRR